MAVWCADDRRDALTKAKRGENVERKTCDNPVKAEYELGQKLGAVSYTHLDVYKRQLLNQSVLLRGINDAVATLAELSEVLFAARVLPYYLHSLDRVRGAAHYEVNEIEAWTIMDLLRCV